VSIKYKRFRFISNRYSRLSLIRILRGGKIMFELVERDSN